MPRIQEYAPSVQAAGPVDLRSARNQDTGEVGNSLEKLGDALTGVGDAIHKRQAQSEVSSLAASFATLHADQTNALDQSVQQGDANDGNFHQNFMQNFDDQVSKLGENVSTAEGRQYYQKAVAEYRGHFDVQAQQAQAHAAGVQAVVDHQQMVNQTSSALVDAPSGFETAVKNYKSYLDGMVQTGGLPAEKRAELEGQGLQKMATSSFFGYVDINPQYAKQKLLNGDYDQYINGDQKQELIGHANVAMHAQQVEAERQQKVLDDQMSQAQEATQKSFLARLEKNQLSTKDVLNSNLNFDQQKQMLGMIKTSQSGELKTDPNTYVNLFNRIHLPDGDPNKITDETQLNKFFGNGISHSTLMELRQEVEGRKTEEGAAEAELKKNFVNMAKDSLTKANPMLGMKDPEGDLQFQRFTSNFLQEYNSQRKAGKTPYQLLSPDSKDYMGGIINLYKRSGQQMIQSMTQSFSTPPSQTLTGQLNSNPSATTTSVGNGATPPAAQGAPIKTRTVSPDEIDQYAKKYKLSPADAKAHLKTAGYDVGK